MLNWSLNLAIDLRNRVLNNFLWLWILSDRLSFAFVWGASWDRLRFLLSLFESHWNLLNSCGGIQILFGVTERCDVEFENVCFELRIPRALNELIAPLLRRLMVLTLVVLLLVLFVSLLIRIDLNGGRGGRLSLRDRCVPFWVFIELNICNIVLVETKSLHDRDRGESNWNFLQHF